MPGGKTSSQGYSQKRCSWAGVDPGGNVHQMFVNAQGAGSLDRVHAGKQLHPHEAQVFLRGALRQAGIRPRPLCDPETHIATKPDNQAAGNGPYATDRAVCRESNSTLSFCLTGAPQHRGASFGHRQVRDGECVG